MQKAVYMSDIARECGVSKRAVSAAFTSHPHSNVRCSPALKEKILATAARLGYRPNRTARQFVQRRHGAVGVLIRDVGDLPQSTLRSILLTAKQYDLHVLLEETIADCNSSPKLLRESCVDGLILIGSTGGDRYPGISQLGIPVLEVNTNRRTGPWCITYDEEEAGSQIMQLAKRQGRKQAVFVTTRPSPENPHYSDAARTASLKESAARLALAPPILIPLFVTVLSSNKKQGVETLQQALRWGSGVDWVILQNDHLAGPLYQAAAAVGRRIPENLGVIAYEHRGFAEDVFPALTTVGINHEDLGHQIIVRMIAALAGEPPDLPPLRIPYQLVERDSTSRLPPGATGSADRSAESALVDHRENVANEMVKGSVP